MLLVLAMPAFLYAACGGPSPNLVAASHSYSDVNDCVVASTYDDTITVPAGDGSETWASTLVISKGVRLKGPGSGSLTIYTNASLGISLTPDATSVTNGHVFEIDGFTFDGGSSDDVAIQLGSAGQTGYPVVNFHDNIIQNYASASGYGSFRYNGPWKGVVYNNTWTGNAKHCFRHLGDQAAQWNWADFYTYATSDVLFFEDNTFNASFTVSSGGWSSRAVIRFNQYNISTNLYPLVDEHGNQPSGVCAMMGYEFYKNTINASGGYTARIAMRGGRVMQWGNELTNGTYEPLVWNDDCEDEPGTCARDGDTQTFFIQDSYHFRNLDDGTLRATTEGFTGGSYCDSEITENAQWWNENATFTPGTDTTLATGIGIGTAAQMAIVDTCTEGVGFWVTDEGEWDSTNGATPDGRLYTCNASNTFVLYYTPYTYPHPLQTGDITAPTITSVNTDTSSGTYTTDDVIDIDVYFSEVVTSDGNVTVTLETGDTDRDCTFTVTAASSGTCNYTVVDGDISADLEVKTIAGTIADAASNAMTNFVPTTNLAANKDIVIQTDLAPQPPYNFSGGVCIGGTHQ